MIFTPAKKGLLENPLFARLLIALVAVIMCFQMVVPAQAAQTVVYIQTSVDLSTWEILSSVTRNSVGATAVSPEPRRIDRDSLDELISNSANVTLSSTLSDKLDDFISDYENGTAIDLPGNAVTNFISGLTDAREKNRPLTFPGGGLSNGGKSTSADMNKALEVNDALIYDLNNAFSLWLKEKYPDSDPRSPSLSAFYAEISDFLSDCVKSSLSSKSGMCRVKDPDSTTGDNRATYLQLSGEDLYFRFRIEKGYLLAGHDSSLITVPNDEDTQYVNWAMFIYEGFYNYMLEGDEAVTEQNVYSAVPGQLEKALSELFGSMLDGLRGVLGLWSMDELMFNTGFRGTGYVGGIFPLNWEPTIWALFLFMEIFAALILLYGIINNVLKKAMSTMNTIARMHAMEQVQDIIVCAIALALLPFILRIVISLSSSFTEMIYAMVPDTNGNIPATGEKREIASMVARYNTGGGTIAGIIAQFLFFGVQVYFNFFYALRGLSTALLIIISPIMIAMISVSDSRKQATVQWAKELLANICIQPIHSFCMTVILLLPSSSHGFDNLIALYALIPFTSVMRGLFFGNAGSWADQAANNAKGRMTGALTGAAGAAGGALIGGAAAALANRNGGQSGGSGTGGAGGTSGEAPTSGDTSNLGPASTQNTTANTGASGGASTNSEGKQGFISKAKTSLGQVLHPTEDQKATREQQFNQHVNDLNLQKARATSPMQSAQISAQKGLAVAAHTAGNATAKVANSRVGKAAGKVTGSVVGGAGAVAKSSPRIVAGAGLAALGGAMAGAGVGGYAAYTVTNLGTNLARPKPKTDTNNGSSTQPNNPSKSASASSTAEGSSTEQPTPNPELGLEGTAIPQPQEAQAHEPLTMKDMGADRGTYVDRGELVQRTDFTPKDMESMGIKDIYDDKGSLAFTASGDSPQTQELGAYADYLQTLPPKEQAQEVSARGIHASRNDDGSVRVSVNKRDWSKANDGATIRTVQDRSTGQDSFRIQNKAGAAAPSFTGGIQTTVSTASVTNATRVPVSSPTVYRAAVSGGASPTEAQAKIQAYNQYRGMKSSGMTATQAVEAMRNNEATPQVAAPAASYEQLIIPKEGLSPSMQVAMQDAVEQKRAIPVENGYSMLVNRGEDVTMTPQPRSFTEYMKANPAGGAPYPVTPSPQTPPQTQTHMPTRESPPASSRSMDLDINELTGLNPEDTFL